MRRVGDYSSDGFTCDVAEFCDELLHVKGVWAA